jgi:hypothetical protein
MSSYNSGAKPLSSLPRDGGDIRGSFDFSWLRLWHASFLVVRKFFTDNGTHRLLAEELSAREA